MWHSSVVVYSSERTCLARFTEHTTSAQSSVLHVQCGHMDWVLACVGAPRTLPYCPTLTINALYAQAIHLHEHAEVTWRLAMDIPEASEVVIEPASAADWTMIYTSSEQLETDWLQQLQVVTVGSTVPVWLAQSPVYFTIVSAIPSDCVHLRLSEGTRVVVNDAPERPQMLSPESISTQLHSPFTQPNCDEHTKWHSLMGMSSSIIQPATQCLRVLPLNGQYTPSLSRGTTVALCSVHSLCSVNQSLLSALSIGHLPFLICSAEIRVAHKQTRMLMVVLRDCSLPTDHIVVPEWARQQLGLDDWLRCTVHFSAVINQHTQNLCAVPNSDNHSQEVMEPLNMFLNNQSLSQVNGVRLPLVLPRFGLKFANFGLFAADHADADYNMCWPANAFNIEMGEQTMDRENAPALTAPNNQPNNPVQHQPHMPLLSCLNEFTTSVWQSVQCGHTLLSGATGTGKSTLAHTICTTANTHMYYTRYYVLCDQYNGRALKGVLSDLASVIQDCVWHAPSLLVLDSFQHLAHSPTSNTEQLNSIASDRQANLIMRMCLRAGVQLRVLAITHELHDIHPTFTPARGTRFFRKHLQMPELSQEDRMSALSELCCAETPRSVLQQVAEACQGFVLADLCRLANRALLIQQQSGTHTLHVPATATDVAGESCLERAICDFLPIAHRHGQAQRSLVQDCGWQQVAGMSHVKHTLTRTFLWPSKYCKLLSDCPIRMSQSALLYGPTGTGKTLIARAIAAECKFNVFIVNGPELLSKYIGQSEQSVRDLFTKARNCRPCMIFFDEFDSLAPKRGHDSTGVTDRVVNQLLTEMDGVDTLQGVYVLAASSRPDLLDAALLRPGRIDNLIPCNLPDKEEQVQILECLTRNVNLSMTEVESRALFNRLVHESNGFSGADLKAVVSGGQLAAVHTALHDHDHTVTINELHIQQAYAQHCQYVTQQHTKLVARVASLNQPFSEQRATLA